MLLNGCHTAELAPLTPVNFVDAFSDASAGGMIGAEITLAQAMGARRRSSSSASWPRSRKNVGEAVQRLR